jgi:hypothetical protein
MAKFKTLVPVFVEFLGDTGRIGMVASPHTDEATDAIGRFNRFRRELELLLASIRQTAGVIKSDDVVSDENCDEIVALAAKIAGEWNQYMFGSNIVDFISVPEELELSETQAVNEYGGE